MTYLRDQIDGLNGVTNDEYHLGIEETVRPKAKDIRNVFPSRSTHRCKVKDRPGVWLEIIAWSLITENGETYVEPITQFGSYSWDMVSSYMSPNIRQSQVHW